MSNKDLVARARAMLTADDVDTKDMMEMVAELADALVARHAAREVSP